MNGGVIFLLLVVLAAIFVFGAIIYNERKSVSEPQVIEEAIKVTKHHAKFASKTVTAVRVDPSSVPKGTQVQVGTFPVVTGVPFR